VGGGDAGIAVWETAVGPGADEDVTGDEVGVPGMGPSMSVDVSFEDGDMDRLGSVVWTFPVKLSNSDGAIDGVSLPSVEFVGPNGGGVTGTVVA